MGRRLTAASKRESTTAAQAVTWSRLRPTHPRPSRADAAISDIVVKGACACAELMLDAHWRLHVIRKRPSFQDIGRDQGQRGANHARAREHSICTSVRAREMSSDCSAVLVASLNMLARSLPHRCLLFAWGRGGLQIGAGRGVDRGWHIANLGSGGAAGRGCSAPPPPGRQTYPLEYE